MRFYRNTILVYWVNLMRYSFCALPLVPLQDELSKTDQDVGKCKHHKKHYDEKRTAHLRSIQALEGNLESKEQELQVH